MLHGGRLPRAPGCREPRGTAFAPHLPTWDAQTIAGGILKSTKRCDFAQEERLEE